MCSSLFSVTMSSQWCTSMTSVITLPPQLISWLHMQMSSPWQSGSGSRKIAVIWWPFCGMQSAIWVASRSKSNAAGSIRASAFWFLWYWNFFSTLNLDACSIDLSEHWISTFLSLFKLLIRWSKLLSVINFADSAAFSRLFYSIGELLAGFQS